MKQLLSFLAELFEEAVEEGVRRGLRPLSAFARRGAIALAVLSATVFFYCAGFGFILLGIFFRFSELERFVWPALYTGGIALLGGVILLPIAVRLFVPRG